MIFEKQDASGMHHLTELPKFLDMDMFKNFKRMRLIEITSLNSFRKFCEDNRLEDPERGIHSHKKGEWHGTETYDDFLKIMKTGDEDILKKISSETKKQFLKIQSSYEEMVTSYNYDVMGELFDIGLVLSGVPEAWLHPQTSGVEKRKVDILFNTSVASNVDTEKVIKNAAKLLSIVKLLEDNDVQVSLKMVTMVTDLNTKVKNGIDVTVSDVKNYDEPINFQKISVFLSPAMLRRGFFRMAEVQYGSSRHDGYGRVYSHNNVLSFSDDSVFKFEKSILGVPQ